MVNNQQTAPISPARIERLESAAEAYKSVERDIVDLPETQIGRITTDVTQAASIALGTVSNLERLRPDFEKLADGAEVLRALDALPNVALAAVYANLQVEPKVSDGETQALLEEARPIRGKLLLVAEGLASFGILSDVTVKSIREGLGNLDTAKDLVALSVLFTSNWDRVEGKVPFGPELLERAARLGPQLLTAIGAKEVGVVAENPSFDWTSLRSRAFRVLVNTYEVLRRATSHVRWYDNDAAAFTPSLHNGFSKRRRSSKGADGNDSEEPSNETQPLTSDQVALGGNAPAVEVGLPDSPPFAP